MRIFLAIDFFCGLQEINFDFFATISREFFCISQEMDFFVRISQEFFYNLQEMDFFSIFLGFFWILYRTKDFFDLFYLYLATSICL